MKRLARVVNRECTSPFTMTLLLFTAIATFVVLPFLLMVWG
jgi:hypothetical protein